MTIGTIPVLTKFVFGGWLCGFSGIREGHITLFFCQGNARSQVHSQHKWRVCVRESKSLICQSDCFLCHRRSLLCSLPCPTPQSAPGAPGRHQEVHGVSTCHPGRVPAGACRRRNPSPKPQIFSLMSDHRQHIFSKIQCLQILSGLFFLLNLEC